MADAGVEAQFTALFKRRFKGLEKRYRQIRADIQPVLEQVSLGNFVGDRVAGTDYVFTKSGLRIAMLRREKVEDIG
jgi:hypothetical protein